MSGSVLVNIEFNNLFASKVNLLYLYYKLRIFAAKHAGCFKDFNMTHNERYRLLPKMQELGWVNGDMIVNYRSVCRKFVKTSVMVRIEEDNLKTISKFKGYLVASAEAYILNRNNKIQEGKASEYKGGTFVGRRWVNGDNSKFWLKSKKIDDNGEQALIGRVYLSTLSNIMGVDERTLQRWRKDSTNRYTLKKYKPESTKSFGRTPQMYYKTSHGMFTVDQYIVTKKDVFNNKYGINLKITS